MPTRLFIPKLVFACFALSSFQLCFATTDDRSNSVYNTIILPKKEGKITVSLQQAMDYYKVPAISFAVIEDNKIIWADALGYLNSEKIKKVNTNTLFQAGSMSKSLTAITALCLADQEKLSLDAPIDTTIKSLNISNLNKYTKHPLNLRTLLNMSSGLDVSGYYGYEPGETLPSVVETLAGKKPANNSAIQLLRHPGSQYDYSGGGFEVVHFLINTQTSCSLTDCVKELVLDPLAMNHSNYQQPLKEQFTHNAAWASDKDGKSFSYRWRVVPEYAAGGLWSTPSDMAKFVIGVIDAYQGKQGAILTQSLAREALTQQKNTPYGLGFVVSGEGKQLHFMKLGQNAGYQGWLVGFPNTQQGAVVMTNSDNGRELAQRLIHSIAKAYKWPTDGTLKDAWMVE